LNNGEISGVFCDDTGRESPFLGVAEAKQDASIYESPEKRELFEKTLAAMRQIMGRLEEISSRWGEAHDAVEDEARASARAVRAGELAPGSRRITTGLKLRASCSGRGKATCPLR
jgi:hypothetical protein